MSDFQPGLGSRVRDCALCALLGSLVGVVSIIGLKRTTTSPELLLPGQSELDAKYAAFLAERNAKVSLSEAQQKFLDQTLITLGGGALGLTLTFVHDHGTATSLAVCAYVGIGSLVLSVILVLVSLYSSQKSISDHIDALDELCRSGFVENDRTQLLQKNPWAGLTAWLNAFAMICIVVGIVAVSAFVAANLTTPTNPTGDETQMKNGTKSTNYQTTSQQHSLKKGVEIKPPPPPPPPKSK